MRTLALLLLSGSLAFGQAFTFADPAFAAGLSGGAASCTTNGVDTAFTNKLFWLKGENDTVDTVTSGTLTNTAIYGTGFVGNSVLFSGDYDLTSTNDYTFASSGYFTAEGWLYRTNTSPSVFASCVSGEFRFGNSNDEGTLNFYYNGNEWFCATASILPVDTWFHFAFVYNDTIVNFYVNGVKYSATTPGAGALAAVTSPIIVGRYDGGGFYVNGLLDELTIYDRALSCNEIFTIYTLGAAGKP